MSVHLRPGSLVIIFQASISSLFEVYSPFGSAVTLTAALLSDRYAARGIVISLVSIFAVAGFALFLSKVALLDSDVSFLSHVLIRR